MKKYEYDYSLRLRIDAEDGQEALNKVNKRFLYDLTENDIADKKHNVKLVKVLDIKKVKKYVDVALINEKIKYCEENIKELKKRKNVETTDKTIFVNELFIELCEELKEGAIDDTKL